MILLALRNGSDPDASPKLCLEFQGINEMSMEPTSRSSVLKEESVEAAIEAISNKATSKSLVFVRTDTVVGPLGLTTIVGYWIGKTVKAKLDAERAAKRAAEKEAQKAAQK